MGSRRVDSLDDFARYEMNVQVECRCGHKGVIDSKRALWVFVIHRWPRSKYVMGEHFVCSRCRKRGSVAHLTPSPAQPTFPDWGPKSPEDAQKLVRRRRG